MPKRAPQSAKRVTVVVLTLVLLGIGGSRLLAFVQLNPPNWGLQRIDRPQLPLDGQFRYFADGTGVNIYIIDTGVRSTHSDFKDAQGNSRVTYVGDFCNATATGGVPRTTSQETYDDGYDGHGTHNASFAAGTVYGVAKNARIFSLRAQSNSTSEGPDCGDNINGPAMTWAVRWITQYGQRPAVVNISFAFDAAPTDLQSSIHASIQAGFVYTLSDKTGGSGHWGTTLPNEAFVVAGTRSDDTPLGSGYGPDLALFAPAAGLYGAGRLYDTEFTIPEGCCAPAGDSFAVPWVTGVAAVLLQQNRSATPAQIRTAILSRAVTVPGLPQRMLQENLISLAPVLDLLR